MKLKYATKLFIIVNIWLVTFRTLQIIFLTDSKTRFLKSDMIIWNTLGIILSILAIAALFINTIGAFRQPKKINFSGYSSLSVGFFCGLLFIIGGTAVKFSSYYGKNIVFIFALLASLAFFLLGYSALGKYEFPKIASLAFLAFMLIQLIGAYFIYTPSPLRMRVIYEFLTICFALFFFLSFGKVICGVNPKKNLRMLYPFGLCTCCLSTLSLIPEFIALIFGFKENITLSAVNPLILFALSLFSGYLTLNTFKRSNIYKPNINQ